MSDVPPSRDELALNYLDEVPYELYPMQEEALMAWFEEEQGVLVCAPTGTGKTLIAEAALYEALHTGRVAYYTTPLIALTEQKFQEMRESAVRWGFSEDDIGLVTGNRSVNPGARVLVVVAEILLNRLLHREAFDFDDVSAVVMDEFHNFADRERGIVWELALGLLPKHVRLLLLSATVGNSAEFIVWLRSAHDRKVRLIQSSDRRVPLQYEWVGDQLLEEQLETMAAGDEATRTTPVLVFCFNREACWATAEQLKGKRLLADGQQKRLADELANHDWSQGAGPKLKPILLRGVGVHHAGMLPRYRRAVEYLFQRKLLSVCVCTETLAAGINLPARSVLLTSLVKGPPREKKLIEASSAHQMFGRAGRPQFDDKGFVFAIAHEDDVKIARFKEKYDQIPEDTKDPALRRAKKKLKKKMPTRRKNEQYWNEAQFEKVIAAPPGKLYSKGALPWRLLAYLLQISPEVDRLRRVVNKRLMDSGRLEAAQKTLNRMLLTLYGGGYVTLDPQPPQLKKTPKDSAFTKDAGNENTPDDAPSIGTFGMLLKEAQTSSPANDSPKRSAGAKKDADDDAPRDVYQPVLAQPTPALDTLLGFRSINPLYGAFLQGQLGIADRCERIQAFESVLDVPGSVAKHIRVPRYEEMPPGPLAVDRLDNELMQRGLVSADDLKPKTGRDLTWEERWVPTFAEKLRLLFDSEFPGVRDLRTTPVWSAGELLSHGGDFNKYVTAKALTKQEGMLFRHLLRLILLLGEFQQVAPPDTTVEEWQADLSDVAEQLTVSCRGVDPESTDKTIEAANSAPDIVKGESPPPE